MFVRYVGNRVAEILGTSERSREDSIRLAVNSTQAAESGYYTTITQDRHSDHAMEADESYNSVLEKLAGFAAFRGTAMPTRDQIPALATQSSRRAAWREKV